MCVYVCMCVCVSSSYLYVCIYLQCEVVSSSFSSSVVVVVIDRIILKLVVNVKAVNQQTNFLRDDRARNLEEAILWHEGEGEASVTATRSCGGILTNPSWAHCRVWISTSCFWRSSAIHPLPFVKGRSPRRYLFKTLGNCLWTAAQPIWFLEGTEILNCCSMFCEVPHTLKVQQGKLHLRMKLRDRGDRPRIGGYPMKQIP